MYIGPLTFQGILKEKPWGGRALRRVCGKELPPGRFGESWELADHPNGVTVVRGGPLDGRKLSDVMRRHRRTLLGPDAPKRFPLIVKLIDASQRLSVQVHPTDNGARALRLNDRGKLEAWYVLESRGNGAMIAGLKSRCDFPRLSALARAGNLAQRLRCVHPRKGEAWLCEPGAIHALGPGLVMLEIQQNSDATLRIHDWGRPGLDGKPRPLHIDEAVRALGDGIVNVRCSRPRALRGLPFKARRLVGVPCFVMDHWRIPRAVLRPGTGRFEILHIISGSGVLDDGLMTVLSLRKGMTVLIPACVSEYMISPRGALEIIRAAEPGERNGA